MESPKPRMPAAIANPNFDFINSLLSLDLCGRDANQDTTRTLRVASLSYMDAKRPQPRKVAAHETQLLYPLGNCYNPSLMVLEGEFPHAIELSLQRHHDSRTAFL